ncbi:MAG: YbhN family protein [Ilumatobacteraceae bacterium]
MSGAILCGFALAIVTHRSELAEAFRQIGGLSAGWVAVLLVLSVAGIASEGLYASSVTPGLTVGHAVMVQQTTTAANNTVIGSGPVSTGLRIAMLRSWSITDTSIAITVVALNVIAAYKLWIVALLMAFLGLGGAASGSIDTRVFAVIAAVAIVVLTASTVLWWTLLHRPIVAAWIAQQAQRGWDRARRRWPRLPDAHLPAIVEHARAEAHVLARLHGGRIVVTSLVDQLIGIARPVAVVRAFGIDASVLSLSQVLIAYGLVRLAVALTPVPGGIGVAEVGLAALLTRLGGPPSTVLAAVLTYRALTFVLPMLTGAVCFTIWRRERRRAITAGPPGSDIGDDGAGSDHEHDPLVQGR